MNGRQNYRLLQQLQFVFFHNQKYSFVHISLYIFIVQYCTYLCSMKSMFISNLSSMTLDIKMKGETYAIVILLILFLQKLVFVFK